MEITLHIGTEKTGTTTIQRFLALNRKVLFSKGILIPNSLGEENNRMLPSMVTNPECIDDFFRKHGLLEISAREAAKEKWRNAFINEVKIAKARHCVICSEHLQSRLRNLEELQRLRKLLLELFSHIKIVLYIRRPIDTAVSLYSTAIKYGSVANDVPPPSNAYYRHIVNHAETIQLWRGVFPDAEFVIRLFSSDAFVNGNLIDDFIDACSLPRADYSLPSAENESLSILGLEILKRVNAHCPLILDDGTMNPQRQGIVPYFERHFSVGARLKPSSHMIEMYEQEFAASNEWVRSLFFPHRSHLFPEVTPVQQSPMPFDSEQLDALANAITELWELKSKSA